jgi:hypothetical protein
VCFPPPHAFELYMLKVSIVKALLASQKEEVELINARDFALIVPSKVADKSKKVSYLTSL